MPDALEPRAEVPRMFGADAESTPLPWSWATDRLVAARNYWIGTTRGDGGPHARPVWGVWLDGAFYFSTGSRAVVHLAARPEITVHLERGSEAVIIEAQARRLSDSAADRALVVRIVDAYNPKYHWDMDPDALPGPFYEVTPRVAFGWTSDDTGLDHGAGFEASATRRAF